MGDRSRDISGVLLLDKAEGRSSNGELQAVRRLYGARKAGHTGTLDPFATGLLPVCFGEATKFAQRFLDMDKEYVSTSMLGVATDSLDKDGAVVLEKEVEAPSPELVREALAKFRGGILQTPPMHSALKKDGKPLYRYAREGVEIEREPRRVRIDVLELLEYRFPFATVRTRCSKGTYIRVLMSDVFSSIGVPSHLVALRRIGTGGFDVSRAFDFAALEAMTSESRDALLSPPDVLVADLPSVRIDDADARALLEGRIVHSSDGYAIIPPVGVLGADPSRDSSDAGLLRAYASNSGLFIGLVEREGGVLRARRMMNLTPSIFG